MCAPINGLNAEWEDARLAGMYDVGVPARGVVPVDVPYAVLAQFLSSGQRPDTVEWELGERMPAILSDEGWELRN
ncbi:hypothetical protein GCM10010483_33520 [Actinokineospora diospyrosa]